MRRLPAVLLSYNHETGDDEAQQNRRD